MTAETLHSEGLNRWRSGDPRGAIDLVTRAVELAPASSTYRNTLGVLFASATDTASAAIHFRRALALSPSDRPAWLNLGHALRGREPDSSCFSAYTRAHVINPTPESAQAVLNFASEIHNQIGRAHV